MAINRLAVSLAAVTQHDPKDVLAVAAHRAIRSQGQSAAHWMALAVRALHFSRRGTGCEGSPC
jgi:hypothetical protein